MSSSKQMNTVVEMLSSKYGFDVEEGKKYVEENVKSVEKNILLETAYGITSQSVIIRNLIIIL